MDKFIIISFGTLSLLIILMILIVLSRKSPTFIPKPKTILDMSLKKDKESKTDQIMKEIDSDENLDYFVELAVFKLKNSAEKISDDEDYQNSLLLEVKKHFDKLNTTLPSKTKKQGLKLSLSLSKILSDCEIVDVEKEDVKTVIDSNENLITIIYPCLL